MSYCLACAGYWTSEHILLCIYIWSYSYSSKNPIWSSTNNWIIFEHCFHAAFCKGQWSCSRKLNFLKYNIQLLPFWYWRMQENQRGQLCLFLLFLSVPMVLIRALNNVVCPSIYNVLIKVSHKSFSISGVSAYVVYSLCDWHE